MRPSDLSGELTFAVPPDALASAIIEDLATWSRHVELPIVIGSNGVVTDLDGRRTQLTTRDDRLGLMILIAEITELFTQLGYINYLGEIDGTECLCFHPSDSPYVNPNKPGLHIA
jgi:hypothetical protein